MGSEAYGLIGFFTMLQSWFALLDLGLTPTVGRETARFRAGSVTVLQYRQLFRALSFIFVFIAIVGGGGLLLSAGYLSKTWLSFSKLTEHEVLFAVRTIAICVALRWVGGLFRGVISGAECLVWLSCFNAVIASLRFVLVFLSMWLYGFTPTVFFVHQFFVALIEMLGLLVMTRKLLPKLTNHKEHIGYSFSPIKSFIKFSLSIAFTSAVWVMVTQTDKLVLSGILPLAEYGHFSLAVIVAGGILVLSGPVSSALMPRMASLHAKNNNNELIELYRKSTRFVAVITGPVSITMALCAQPLLYAWTGDSSLAEESAVILSLYSLGNGFLVMGAFPYYLQYAKGNVKYHVIGNLITLIFLVPSLILSATFYGGVGAGVVWLAINAFFTLGWVTYVHYRLEPGLQWVWLFKDWLKICIPAAVTAYLIDNLLSFDGGRLEILLKIASVGLGTLLIALLCSGYLCTAIHRIKRGG